MTPACGARTADTIGVMSYPENPQGVPQPPQAPQNPYAQPVHQYAPGAYASPLHHVPVAPRNSSLAIWALVLGIASFVPVWFAWLPVIGWFTPLFPLAAVILGHMALGQIRRLHLGGRGMAITGLVLGYVFIAFDILILLVSIVVGAFFIGTVGTLGTTS